MGKRNKVTTRDIAEYTGLSQSTVSMILSGRKNVSFTAETEQIVRDAAKKLGYKRPVKKAAELESNLKDTILLLAPLLSNSYYTSIIHSITEQAGRCGYDVFTAVTFRNAEREHNYLSLAKKNRLAGIIILYPISEIALANTLSKDLPIVQIGEKPDNIRFDSIELNSSKPGLLMGEHLISLGHTHIAFISSPIKKHEISRRRRLDGLHAALRGAGLNPGLIEIYTPSSAEFQKYGYQSPEYRTGYDMTIKALSSGTKATAFVGQNDMTAYGIMAALSDQGYRIPADYSVAGFDDSRLSSMPQISLTTVEHAAVQKGQDAVNLIYERNHQSKGSRSQRITRMEYEPRLIRRGSTGKARVLFLTV